MTTTRPHGIDPEIAAVIADSERPDLAGDLEGARRTMGSSGLPIAQAEASFGARVVVSEHTVVRDDRSFAVRVYRPRALVDPAPALLLLHGGAFVGGDRGAEHARSLRYAAEAGCIVVCPEYRLAPEHRYPAALDDVLATLDWMADPELRIDPERTGIGGVSAGGALAAGAALKLRDRGQQRLRALMLLYPVIDDRLQSRSMMELTDAPVWDPANTREMWALYLRGGHADEYAAPGRAARLHGLPPSYVSAADGDPLRDEALAFARRLIDSDVLVDIRLWSGTVHVFDQLAPDTRLAKHALGDQLQFLRRYLTDPIAKRDLEPVRGTG